MKKLNNKGFAITVMLYSVLGIIVMTLMLILTTMSGMRKNNTTLINHIKVGLNKLEEKEIPVANYSYTGNYQTYVAPVAGYYN
ncbi:MAG: hypothetical protein RR406_04945, partial [Bacilli bacterium]